MDRVNEKVTDIKTKDKPELLAPCGSIDVLRAALSAGADAVYFGGQKFNARANAVNFTEDEIEAGLDLCHANGVKGYVTLNTVYYGSELTELLKYCEFLYNVGADALIVTDLGAVSLIKKYFPDFELHASTQCTGHNIYAAKKLKELGFSRMVCSRELSYENIKKLCSADIVDIEMFVHGAMCVSHSGQCLMSSFIGNRSGNRGECAQPCRLPYKNCSYGLSLKDMCLAGHITDVLNLGVSSLKIEGRMKSRDYVYGVVSVYRKLIDEKRNATKREIDELTDIFSRSGFSCGYFENKIDKNMLGVRSEEQKQITRSLTYDIEEKKVPVDIEAFIEKGKKAKLKLTSKYKSVTVEGEFPEEARTAPLTLESVKKQLTKLGATPFYADEFSLLLDNDLMIPVSGLNNLRRKGVEELLSPGRKTVNLPDEIEFANVKEQKGKENKIYRSARFSHKSQITQKAKEYFDDIYLPLDKYDSTCANGVVIFPVVFDSETETVINMARQAYDNGARKALVGNLSMIDPIKDIGYDVVGDYRLNVTNTESFQVLTSLGISDIILSPELILARIKEFSGCGQTVVYGRVPVMTLEKCIIRDIDKKRCDGISCASLIENPCFIVDRMGACFPVVREFDHRNVVYNSVVVYMADKEDKLQSAKILKRHFMFTVESPEECDRIIDNYEMGKIPQGSIKRIK